MFPMSTKLPESWLITALRPQQPLTANKRRGGGGGVTYVQNDNAARWSTVSLSDYFKSCREQTQKTVSTNACPTGISLLVNWCFEPNQPLGVTSGLRETFIKRYAVERTSKAEVRPEEESENGELSGDFVD